MGKQTVSGDTTEALETQPLDPQAAPVEDRWNPVGQTRAAHFRHVLIDRYWTLFALVVLVVIFSFVATNFLTRANWISTSVYASSLIPLAVGELLVMLTGGIDLSIAGNAACSGMVAALILQNTFHGGNSAGAIVVACVACVACGAAIGAINGFLVAWVKLAPFIVTLGMLEVTTGGVNLISHGLAVQVTSQPLNSFGSSLIGNWLSPLVVVCVVLLVFVGLLLSRTRFGTRTYAIGSNPEAVRRLGVPTKRVIITLYILAGVCAALVGMMTIAQYGTANTDVDTTNELTAIAAVVIGGTSLFGGSGTVLGTVFGVGIVPVLLPGLVLSGLAAFWQTVVTGIVIIAAVAVDRVRSQSQGDRKITALLRTRMKRTGP